MMVCELIEKLEAYHPGTEIVIDFYDGETDKVRYLKIADTATCGFDVVLCAYEKEVTE